MPECQNCEAHVTERYVRVFAPNDLDNPRVCPSCEDKTRGNHGKIRAKRN
ncbi:DUF7563 family protein [Halobaculum rubrum]